MNFGKIVDNVSYEKTFTIFSQTLIENNLPCNLKLELLVPNDENITSSFMGDIVATKEISLNSINNVSLKLDMSGRVKYVDEMGDSITLSYETLNLDSNYDITLEVQKKNELDKYETNSTLVQSVSRGTDLGNGKYSLDLSDSGKINITFLDNLILEKGTYRVYLEVKEENKVILEVPYSFILLEKEVESEL